jgi:hypothetical protein
MELGQPIIPQPQNLAEPFLRGFYLMSQISAQRRRSEEAVQRLQLNNQVDEWRHEKDMQALQQGQQRINDLDQHYQRMDEVKQKSDELKNLQVQKTLSDASNDTQRLIDMQGQVYSIPAKRGTTNYQKALDDILSEYSDVTSSREARRILGPVEQKHKTARAEAFKAFSNRLRSDGLDTYSFAQPAVWRDNTDAKGNVISKYVAIPDPTSPESVYLPNGTSVKGRYRTYPLDQWNNLRSQYDEFYGGAPTPTPTDSLPSVPVISSQEDYEGLDPGSPFIFNGKRGIKPQEQGQ